jgi:2,4-dienoyl-CoA reductase-like NADH-dependent reductase (Old Yellow Enzyme family)
LIAPHFPQLFSPLRLRHLTLRNRIVSTAHGTFMSVDGLPTERIAAYQAARAAGGAGLIIHEASSVHLSGVGASR